MFLKGRKEVRVQRLMLDSKFALEGFTEAIAREMDPEWDIRFLILEPGGVKTEFAGRSLVLGEMHPAYGDERCPYNKIAGLLGSEELKEKAWGKAEDTAEAIFELVMERNVRPWPLRLPLGTDALRMIREDNAGFEKDMMDWADVIQSTTRKEQEESLEFGKWLSTLTEVKGGQ